MMTTNSTLTKLDQFEIIEEAAPYGQDTGTLVQGNNGDFYGTTAGNLISDFGPTVPGTVFKMTPTGALTSLARFNNVNGSYPNGTLVLASDGNFYGTTLTGGDLSLYSGPPGQFYSIVAGFGTVFKISPTGGLKTLVQFEGNNGAYPKAGLVQGTDGNLYGTTWGGGDFDGGTVFMVTPEGVLTTLVSFAIAPNQPQYSWPFSGPVARLLQARDGNFYGTTQGWVTGGATVFQLTPDGTLTTLATLSGTNGSNLQAGLVEGGDGNLYGSAYSDGGPSNGTVFRIVMPSAPTLTISQLGNQIVLSWPTNAVGFVLQSSGDLSFSTNWIDSTASPSIEGAQYFVTNNLVGSAQFFRLKH